MPQPLRCNRSINDILSTLGETAVEEVIDAQPAAWSAKSGFSLFDEEDVLGVSTKASLSYQNDPGWLQAPAAAADFHAPLILNGSSDGNFSELAALDEVGAFQVSWRSAVKQVRRMCCMYSLSEDSESQCPICLDTFRAGQVAWTLPCFHQVHHGCAERYFGARRVKPRCPLCRFNIGCTPGQ